MKTGSGTPQDTCSNCNNIALERLHSSADGRTRRRLTLTGNTYLVCSLT